MVDEQLSRGASNKLVAFEPFQNKFVVLREFAKYSITRGNQNPRLQCTFVNNTVGICIGRVNEGDFAGIAENETDVIIQTDDVETGSPTPDCIDKSVNGNSPKSPDVCVGGQAQDNVFRSLLSEPGSFKLEADIAQNRRYKISARNLSFTWCFSCAVKVPLGAVPERNDLPVNGTEYRFTCLVNYCFSFGCVLSSLITLPEDSSIVIELLSQLGVIPDIYRRRWSRNRRSWSGLGLDLGSRSRVATLNDSQCRTGNDYKSDLWKIGSQTHGQREYGWSLLVPTLKSTPATVVRDIERKNSSILKIPSPSFLLTVELLSLASRFT